MSNSKDNHEPIPAEVVAGFVSGEDERKTERVDVRVGASQFAALGYVAERLSKKPSEAIRIMAFNPDRLATMLARREWDLVGDYVGYRKAVNECRAELSRLRIDIGRIGNNVNQIAKRANENKSISHADARLVAEGFEPLRREVEETCKTLQAQCDKLLEAYEDLGPFEG